MIIDQLTNYHFYPYGPAFQDAMQFLSSLPADAQERKYELRGTDIFAQVARYRTQPFAELVFESHEKYVDVQAVLAGRERMEVVARDQLRISQPYDTEKDVAFYQQAPGSFHLDLVPGNFVLLFPHDAHMPGTMLGKEPEAVTKVVIKIKAALLRGGK